MERPTFDVKMYSSHQDAVGIDGEAIEFEWKNLERKNIQPKEFMDRIIFMSMFNDILWKADDQNCISNAEKVKDYAKQFLPGHWTFLGPGSEERWYNDSHDQQGQWDRTANKMVQQFQEMGILSLLAPVL